MQEVIFAVLILTLRFILYMHKRKLSYSCGRIGFGYGRHFGVPNFMSTNKHIQILLSTAKKPIWIHTAFPSPSLLLCKHTFLEDIPKIKHIIHQPLMSKDVECPFYKYIYVPACMCCMFKMFLFKFLLIRQGINCLPFKRF